MRARLISVVALAATLTLAPAPVRAQSGGRGVLIDVPYLTQTEALCGGAAAAMVLRYLGDQRARAEDFAALVDDHAGGIRDDHLVAALEGRGWTVVRLDATYGALQESISAGEPPILLIEVRADRYHYVVATSIDDDSVFVHDPAWGPERRIDRDEFLQRWRAARQWAIALRPGSSNPESERSAPAYGVGYERAERACDPLLQRAQDEIERTGLQSAGRLLGELQRVCADDSRPTSELSGVRFAERQFADASRLAKEALALDEGDVYAWNVLGASRFMLQDLDGALAAWNAVQRPRIDRVRIHGLTGTAFIVAANALGLEPGEVLTPSDFRRAERRLRALPTVTAARLSLRPDTEGYAMVDAHVLERDLPTGWAVWTAAGVRAGVMREVRLTLPGRSGAGEAWSAEWRWWPGRPRVAFGLAVPRDGVWPGVWRVEASRTTESYAAGQGATTFRESRTTGALSVERWLSDVTWYRTRAAVHTWNDRGHAISIGLSVDRGFVGERLSLGGSADWWHGLGPTPSFATGSIYAAARSDPDKPLQVAARGGMDTVTRDAPLSEWSGADTLGLRNRLLRAHPLLVDGRIAGPAFGRRLAYLTGEVERTLDWPRLIPVSAAAFVDLAHASHRMPGASVDPLHVDVGVGVRLRLPGQPGVLRLDYGHGLRDGANAFSVAWRVN